MRRNKQHEIDQWPQKVSIYNKSIVWLGCEHFVGTHGEINMLNLPLFVLFFFFFFFILEWCVNVSSFYFFFFYFLIDEIGNNCLKSQRDLKYAIHSTYAAHENACDSIYLLEQHSYLRHTFVCNGAGLGCDRAIEQIDNHLDQSTRIKKTIKIMETQTKCDETYCLDVLWPPGKLPSLYVFVSLSEYSILSILLNWRYHFQCVNICGYDGQ